MSSHAARILHGVSSSRLLVPSRCTNHGFWRLSRREGVLRQRLAPYSAESHIPSQSSPPSSSTSKSSTPSLTDPSLPSFNLFSLLRTSRPAVRYTVYLGLGLMATVESTFWFHVLKAKFFPAKNEEERAKADKFLGRIAEAVSSARGNWMKNYGAYYGGYVWGVGER